MIDTWWFSMKEYDLIVIGTGSAMDIVNAALQQNPHMKVAVIDKDEPEEFVSHGVVSLQSYCCTVLN
jgi:succinate dehydrogenase/fumarate reductase flavoprotein subunit